jgi:hypothetical protein
MHFSTIYDALQKNLANVLLFKPLHQTRRTIPAKWKNDSLLIFMYAKTIK